MKIIKPLRLSVLSRPFRLKGKNHLGVSVLALADMGDKPKLRPEMELWQLAADELQASGGVIDMAMPKSCAEFLATGFAYSHHQQDKTACATRIEIEQLSKTLLVSGDRFWSGSKATPPREFDQMRLDWSRAFGGEDYAENPHGIGAVNELQDGVAFRRLPNIEALNTRITTPGQKPEPASFGPLDIQWPRRMSRMGKQYDDHWLQNDFPGFSRDNDWRVFNAASPDQWWNERDSLPPQAAWSIWNMHPEKPVQQGTLPPWQARCFINRQRAEDVLFEEIPLRATTVWFFPHLEQMLLIWQGNIRINEDDAADVLQLMPALEKTGATRSQTHYRKVLAQRLDKEKGALFSFREKDLIPEETIGPWLDSELPQSPSPMRDNLKNRASIVREQHRARLKEQRSDINDVMPAFEEPEIPKLDELPEYIAKMERQAEEMKAQAEDRKKELEARFPQDNQDSQPRGPESMHRMQEMLHRNKDQLSEKKLQQTRESLHKLYMMSVQNQPPAVRLKGDIALIIRQRAQRTLALGGDFSGMDLTGVDFSGMDLRGACFKKTLLECANLSRCQLDGADFTDAMLARVELKDATLRGCNFTDATLALAQCVHSDFSHAQFKNTQLDEALVDECCFDDAMLDSLLLRNGYFTRCSLRNAFLESCVFMDLTLPQLDFTQARLHKTTFIKCVFEAAIFSEAQLESCSWVESKLEQVRFDGATLITCAAASGTSMAGADFSQATLKQSNLRQTVLTSAKFTWAKLDSSDFSEALCQECDFTRASLMGCMCLRTDFRHANFTDANLMAALLQKTQLAGANFSHANLFRTDLSQSFTDQHTNLKGAWTKRVKTLPKRDGEVV